MIADQVKNKYDEIIMIYFWLDDYLFVYLHILVDPESSTDLYSKNLLIFVCIRLGSSKQYSRAT